MSAPPPFTSASASGQAALIVLPIAAAEAAALLPTPRLLPLPALRGQTLGAVIAARFAEAPFGPCSIVGIGTFVTYAALRTERWAQRHSLGLWVHELLASTPVELLRERWGLEARVVPTLELSLGQRSLELSGLPSRSANALARVAMATRAAQRELRLYTRRGGRLLNSRLLVRGEGSLGTAPFTPLDLAALQSSSLPRLGARALALWSFADAELELCGPGREYDL